MPDPSGWELIRCVAFDAVGTLIFPDPPVAEVYARVARECGSRLTNAEIEANFRAAFRRQESADFVSGPATNWQTPDGLRSSEPRERDRWRTIVAESIPDAADPRRCFERLFEHFGRPEAWGCFADVAPTLEELSRRGYRLLIASNFDARLEPVWRGRTELAAIERCVVSSLVGFRKPSPVFFHHLVEAAGCARDAVLMVGDDEACDVRGAREAGLRAVRVCRCGEGGDDSLQSLEQLLDVLPGT